MTTTIIADLRAVNARAEAVAGLVVVAIYLNGVVGGFEVEVSSQQREIR